MHTHTHTHASSIAKLAQDPGSKGSARGFDLASCPYGETRTHYGAQKPEAPLTWWQTSSIQDAVQVQTEDGLGARFVKLEAWPGWP
eukprot:480852-Amphidinium_carterae.1